MNTNTSERTQGALHLYVGPMFAGKSTQLLRVATQCLGQATPHIAINHASDTRYGLDALRTHDGRSTASATALTLDEARRTAGEAYTRAAVVLIDEGQFFPDLAEVVISMVDDDRKEVHVAGLDGDFRREKFGRVLDLVPHCNTITKLHARCKWCPRRDAVFTHRNPLSGASQTLVGRDEYIPLCRGCYLAIPETA